MKRTGDFLAWLGGADMDILARVKQERGRFVQMACILLTTSSIAAISMMFAMYNGVKVPLPAAIITGLFWGLIILNIDRFLVLSMGTTRDLGRLIWVSIPRLLLAAVVSLVISTPLSLKIFQSDINTKLASMNLSYSKQLAAQEAVSQPQQEANAVLKKITTDKATQAGHLPQAVTSPQLQTAQQQIDQLQPQVNNAKQQEINAYAAWQCELYGDGPGCAGASNRAGYGPIAQAKHQVYLQALGTYNSLDAQLQTAEQNASAAKQDLQQAQGTTLANDQAAARKELPGLEQRYASLESKIQLIKSHDQYVVAHNDGILAQLSALSAASSRSVALLFAELTVMALFFLIEMLPVTVKFLLNLGSPSAYENVARLTDRQVWLTERKNAERESDEVQKKAEAASRVRVTIAEDMSRREETLGIRANEHVAGRMEEILDAALQEWDEQVRARLNAGLADTPSTSGNGHGATGGSAGPGVPDGSGASAGNGSSPRQQTRHNAQGFGLPPDGGML